MQESLQAEKTFFKRKREIVLDTETTGLDPASGHRIVEIGCVELIDLVPSGETFHVYINPKRDVPAPAFAVHGLSSDFLSDFPPFEEIAQSLLDFLEDAPLVIHNARFDMKFLRAELLKVGTTSLENEVVDTLAIARQKYPGSPASLDMLCRRFNVDNSQREKHGALLDAELLSAVYLELCGGKQPKLELAEEKARTKADASSTAQQAKGPAKVHAPRQFTVQADEQEAHEALLQKLGSASWPQRKQS